MAKQPVMTAALAALVEEFTLRARQVVYGAEGAPELGTLFTEIEDIGCQVGDAVARAMMQQTVETQATHVSAAVCSCGQFLEDSGHEPHPLTSRRGDIGWQEPMGKCPACRRDFFPSQPKTGPDPG